MRCNAADDEEDNTYLADGRPVGDTEGEELGLALTVGLEDGAGDGTALAMKNHAQSLAVSVVPSAKSSHNVSSSPAPSRKRTTN